MHRTNNSNHVTYKTWIVYKVEHHDLWFILIHDSYNLEFWPSFSSLTHITTKNAGCRASNPPSDPHSSWPMACHASAQIHLEATSHKMSQVPGPRLRRNNENGTEIQKGVKSINSPFARTMIPPKVLVPKVPLGCPNVEEAKAPTGSGRICAAICKRHYFKRSDLLHTFFDRIFNILCITILYSFNACIMLGLLISIRTYVY